MAVVRREAGSPTIEPLRQEVVGASELHDALGSLASRFQPDVILVGNGTTSREVVEAARRLGAAPVRVVDERLTTLQARKVYFRSNPRRGLRRLLPLSLQTPDRPYDDYVALILAERYLASEQAERKLSTSEEEQEEPKKEQQPE